MASSCNIPTFLKVLSFDVIFEHQVHIKNGGFRQISLPRTSWFYGGHFFSWSLLKQKVTTVHGMEAGWSIQTQRNPNLA